MQSSFVLAVRALIMLVFLIGVPLVAIFGSAVPEVLKGLLDGYTATSGPATAGGQSKDSPKNSRKPDTTSAEPLRRFDASAGFSSSFPAPAMGQRQPNPLQQGTAEAVRSAEGLPREGQQASFETPVEEAPLAPAHTQDPGIRAPGPYDQAPNSEVHGRPQPLPADSSSPKLTVPELEQRLQQLGASYYRLESWGSGTPTYKFHCMVESSGDAQNKYFQAIEATAEAAMSQVVQQLEDWRRASER